MDRPDVIHRVTPLAVHGLLALGLLTSTAPAAAQSIRGLIVDRDTDVVIELATVIMVDESRDTIASTITDANGFFALTAGDGGTFTVVVEALGYRAVVEGPFDVQEGGAMVVQVVLEPRPVRLDGLLIETERETEPRLTKLVHTGFYDRLAEGTGEFVTPGEIERSTVRFTTQLFREMTLAKLVPNRDGASAPWNDRVLIRPIDPLAEGPYCRPRVYVDDVFIDLFHMDPEPSLEDLVAKEDLEAIEVFRAPFGAPVRYQSTSPCGVVLLWTKLRR